jgi:hypothetical protein
LSSFASISSAELVCLAECVKLGRLDCWDGVGEAVLDLGGVGSNPDLVGGGVGLLCLFATKVFRLAYLDQCLRDVPVGRFQYVAGPKSFSPFNASNCSM